MHRRPKLLEAIKVLKTASTHSKDANSALEEYYELLQKGQVFAASLMVVDIVDHYYHLLDLKGIAHG